ncbi:MAG: VOC family protein [Candidatus Phaeomarinobacter sp.]
MSLTTQIIRRGGSVLDHIGLGVREMTEGCDWFQRRTGVQPWVIPEEGGDVGVRSGIALLGEGPHSIEIVAPDPAASEENPLVQRLRALTEPRLQFWYIAVEDIVRFDADVRASGLPFLLTPQSHRSGDGAYEYKRGFFGVPDMRQKAFAVPFVIQWITRPDRPIPESAGGCDLKEVWVEHNEPEETQALFDALELGVAVRRSAAPRPRLTINTPRGEVTL